MFDVAHTLVATVLVYLDTNIYRHITQDGVRDGVRDSLEKLGWRVIASADNLLETYAIPDTAVRERELRTLTSVARRFEKVPHSYLEAMEVKRALTTHRPSWVRGVVFDRVSRDLRTEHLIRWKEAKRGQLPSPGAYDVYRRDLDSGTREALAFQRNLRQRQVNEEEVVLFKKFGNGLGAVRTDLEHPDAFWRSECWTAYDSALVQRHPATRDLFDWLSPHLRLDLVTTEELFLFWMRDVAATDVPIASWSGMVAWGQLHSKVSHGNVSDQQHAAMAVLTDIFITADENLHKALLLASRHHEGRLARILLWPRSVNAQDALDSVALRPQTRDQSDGGD